MDCELIPYVLTEIVTRNTMNIQLLFFGVVISLAIGIGVFFGYFHLKNRIEKLEKEVI